MNKESLAVLKGIIREVVEEVVQENMSMLVEAVDHKLEVLKESVLSNKQQAPKNNPYLKNIRESIESDYSDFTPSNKVSKSKPAGKSVLLDVLSETRPFNSSER